MADNDVVSLNDQMRAERKYYLGYEKTIPGTDTQVSDARKEYRDKVTEDNIAQEQRRLARFKGAQKDENVVVRTTVVTPGVLADVAGKTQVEVSEAEIAVLQDPDKTGPTVEELVKDHSKAELVDMVRETRGIEEPTGTKTDLAETIVSDLQ